MLNLIWECPTKMFDECRVCGYPSMHKIQKLKVTEMFLKPLTLTRWCLIENCSNVAFHALVVERAHTAPVSQPSNQSAIYCYKTHRTFHRSLLILKFIPLFFCKCMHYRWRATMNMCFLCAKVVYVVAVVAVVEVINTSSAVLINKSYCQQRKAKEVNYTKKYIKK